MKLPLGAVDNLFAAWDNNHSPGAVLAIAKAGELVYKRAYGMADLERRVPLNTESIFDLGSVGKQFVAALALLLEQEGRLKLTDSLRLYIPELPDYSTAIQLRQLIDHTSGIRDYLALMWLTNRSFDYAYSRRELIDLMARQSGLEFEPGEKSVYSNGGYFLLGIVLERVMDKPLVDLLKQYIYEPLGMRNTQGNDDLHRIVPNRALSYYYDDRQGCYITSSSHLGGFGDGPILSNVDDVFLWDQNFYPNRLGKGGQDFSNNGDPLEYAFGLEVTCYRGLPIVYHGGAWAAYHSNLVRFPEQQLSVIYLSNFGNADPDEKACEVVDLLLEQELEPKQKTVFVPLDLPAAPAPLAAESLVGLFRIERNDNLIEFTHSEAGPQLGIQRREFVLRQIGPNHFASQDELAALQISFIDQNQGVIVQQAHRDRFRRVLELDPESYDFDSCVGTYASPELDIVYRIIRGPNGLQLQRGYADPEDLRFRAHNIFESSRMRLAFERNEQNEVNEFYLSMGRVVRMHFRRQSA